ncbi:MAG: triple tyrosine motif-containing protein [Allomuricauda sp.]
MLLRILICFTAFFSQIVYSQEIPPIQNYSPADYRAENQNWSISQDDDKIMYVANNKGLLEFNGADWTLYPSPNESIMRSVKVVEDRIYSGSYMEFGYWTKDRFGIPRYTSIASTMERPPLEDEEFWGILDFKDWILFQSLKRIYIYNTKTGAVSTIDAENTLYRMFQLGNEVFYQENGKGVFKIDNGKAIPIFDEEVLRTDEIINIFKVGENLIFVTKQNGFFEAANGMVKKFQTDLDRRFSGMSVYSAERLADGTYAIGTISDGLIILNAEGELLNHINQLNGLRNNTVLSVFEDSDNNIWLGLDNGLSYLNVKSPIRIYNDNKGVVGSTYSAVLHDGRLYLGTNQGLFYRAIGNDSEFNFIKGTEGQVWSLKEINGTLFCGHHSGTFIVEGQNAIKIAGVQGTWKINQVPAKPNLLLQGNYDGLYVLENREGQWQMRNKLEGFANSARHFELLDNQILVNHEYQGVFILNVDDALTKVNSVSMDTDIRGSDSGIIKFKDAVFYAYKNGILKYQPSSSSFIKDTTLSRVYDPEDYVSGKMTVDKEGNLWIFSNSSINIVTNGTLADTLLINKVSISENVRNDIIGYENVASMEKAGNYLLGTTTGYMLLDINGFKKNDFSVQLGKVANSSRRSLKWEYIDKELDEPFKSDRNHFRLSFFTPKYRRYFTPTYQYQLEGIYDTWSEWSENSIATFENLPFGEYTFRVRAKIGNTISSNTAAYSFKIARPWYLSNTMIFGYVLACIFGSYLIHQAYKRHYHKRQLKLIEKNKHEMELAKAQNEKEIIKIKNEQLQEEFRSKSNELAASTLSIIRKNELLSKVKEQLIANIEDRNSIKPIIRIIDKNITQNDDWEMFMEAFNNADRKFLKKLKKEHPNLSPNDVRLCAYLRLNLSSKEIAPLLNISVRSVEIKRYRLRKKMGLLHDDNLVDYIMQL